MDLESQRLYSERTQESEDLLGSLYRRTGRNAPRHSEGLNVELSGASLNGPEMTADRTRGGIGLSGISGEITMAEAAGFEPATGINLNPLSRRAP
jgi:hypothetical protein